ncbi:G patch domain-containing protein 2-like isoform X3 [Echeneis naucrates]|uniref:G patch domain-containing protein 2-like isoform X3 n=1 Tax=Echeneis naucrates TaxID=173247 RepID=UPI0011133D7B|nr:G patch domain-containing protein 2-like isoform X3 [Echeneis naucrates]
MMDELVQDLVSALEQTSEQSKLGGLWEEMVLSPLQQRRQIRRRRVRRRNRESPLYLTEHRRCWIEASESSLDEAQHCRENSSATITASVANCSDSDDLTSTNQWHSVMRGPARMKQPSWPESDSFSENNPGRPLRRRRKVKRMTSGVTVRLKQKLNVSGVDGRRRYTPSRMQQLSGSKKRSGGWMGAERCNEGARLMGKECWKRKMAQEHRDGADENMSEGETSSTCSSDPGLFTNDEGRQGDDEQSDWFFEGDCGAGTGVAGLLPNWDSDSQLSLDDNRPSATFLQPARPSQRRYHSRLKQLPGSAACCIRKDRRRIPSKTNSMPVFVERLRHFSQDPYQRDFWLPSVGKRERSQPCVLLTRGQRAPISDLPPQSAETGGLTSPQDFHAQETSGGVKKEKLCLSQHQLTIHFIRIIRERRHREPPTPQPQRLQGQQVQHARSLLCCLRLCPSRTMRIPEHWASTQAWKNMSKGNALCLRKGFISSCCKIYHKDKIQSTSLLRYSNQHVTA